jgi:hypothetical protein
MLAGPSTGRCHLRHALLAVLGDACGRSYRRRITRSTSRGLSLDRGEPLA